MSVDDLESLLEYLGFKEGEDMVVFAKENSSFRNNRMSFKEFLDVMELLHKDYD